MILILCSIYLEITIYTLDLLKFNEKWYYFPENEKTMELFYFIYPFFTLFVVCFNSNGILNHIKHYAFMDFGFQLFYYYMPQYDFFEFFLPWTSIVFWIYSLMFFICFQKLSFQTLFQLNLLSLLLLEFQSSLLIENEINEKPDYFIVFHIFLMLLSVFFILLFSMLHPGYFLLIDFNLLFSFQLCLICY